MTDLRATSRVSGSLHAVVTRADGRVENMGLVAFYHRNPLIHAVVNGLIKLKRFVRG